MIFTKEERTGLLIIGVSILLGSFLLSRREEKIVQDLTTFSDKIELMSQENAPQENKVDKKIDLNSATPEELQAIPGIGPKLATAIVERRKTKKFSEIKELLEIKGIGPKKLQTISRYLEVK